MTRSMGSEGFLLLVVMTADDGSPQRSRGLVTNPEVRQLDQREDLRRCKVQVSNKRNLTDIILDWVHRNVITRRRCIRRPDTPIGVLTNERAGRLGYGE